MGFCCKIVLFFALISLSNQKPAISLDNGIACAFPSVAQSQFCIIRAAIADWFEREVTVTPIQPSDSSGRGVSFEYGGTVLTLGVNRAQVINDLTGVVSSSLADTNEPQVPNDAALINGGDLTAVGSVVDQVAAVSNAAGEVALVSNLINSNDITAGLVPGLTQGLLG